MKVAWIKRTPYKTLFTTQAALVDRIAYTEDVLKYTEMSLTLEMVFHERFYYFALLKLGHSEHSGLCLPVF